MSRINELTPETGSELNRNSPRTGPRMLWIMHFGFIVSIFIFMIFHTFLLLPSSDLHEGPQDHFSVMFFTTFMILSAAQCVIGFFIPRFIGGMAPCGGTSAVQYIKCAQMTAVTGNSFFEVIAFYGFFGPFVGLYMWQSYLFFGLALLMLLAVMPRIQAYTREYARRLRSEVHHHHPSVAGAEGKHHHHTPAPQTSA